MIKKDWTDEAIIQAIKGSPKEREIVFQYIYLNAGWRTTFINWSNQQKSNTTDGKDAFQMALIAFDKSVRSNQFQFKGKLKNYFLKVAKHKWIDIQRKKRPSNEIEALAEEEMIDSVENVYISKEKKQYLLKALAQIQGRCKILLWLYALGYTNKEIAKEIGFSSPAMANKATYRCRLEWRVFFENNPNWKELI